MLEVHIQRSSNPNIGRQMQEESQFLIFSSDRASMRIAWATRNKQTNKQANTNGGGDDDDDEEQQEKEEGQEEKKERKQW